MTIETVLIALRANAEGSEETLTGVAGQWRTVYLDNAHPAGLTARQFAGYLSALTQADLYRPIDNYAFGYVRVD